MVNRLNLQKSYGGFSSPFSGLGRLFTGKDTTYDTASPLFGEPALIDLDKNRMGGVPPSRGLLDAINSLLPDNTGSVDLYKQRAPSQIQQIKDNDPTKDLMFMGLENEPINDLSGFENRFNIPTPLTPNLKIGSELTPEEFRSKEKNLVDSQGGLISEQIQNLKKENMATDPKGGDKSLMGGQEAIENLMNKSIMDFVDNVRGSDKSSPKIKTIEKYKEEFAKATGIDVSGKVDKRDAYMAFGAALLQNKAGKKFNLGKVLESVGSASEKAMPLLTKAKAAAKAAGASAGKYALEMRAADTAKSEAAAEKAMEREDYFIIPNIGGGLSGDRAGILSNEGRLEQLNKSELNKLINNKDFSDKFTVLPGSMHQAVLAETMKTPEAAELYDTKAPRKIELFGEGANSLFTVETWRSLPQSGVDSILVGKGTDTYKALSNAARDLEKAKLQFVSGFDLVEGTNVFNFTLDKVDSIAAAFGIDFKPGANRTEKLRLFLTKLQAQNAKEILGEAGKTISDADRALVASIVGNISLLENEGRLTEKLNQLYQQIIVQKEQKIIDALASLDRYSGRKVSESLSGNDMSDEEREELESYEPKKGVTA